MIDPLPAARMCGNTARDSSHNANVDIEGLVKIFFAERFRRSRQQHRGIIHEDVDALELLDCCAYEFLDIAGAAYVGAHGQAFTADFCGGAVKLLDVPPGNHHLGALAHKGKGDGFANAATPAGDDGSFMLQAHRGILNANSTKLAVFETSATISGYEAK